MLNVYIKSAISVQRISNFINLRSIVMATITDKIVTLQKLGTFKGEADKVYQAQESGKGLSTNDYDNTEKGKVAGAVQESALDGKVSGLGYVKDEALEGYAKSEDLDGYVQKSGDKVLSDNNYSNADKAKVDGALQESALSSKLGDLGYVDGDAVDGKISDAVNKIGTVKGACTKAELASKKTGANLQDIYVVTDDDNHLYMFIGVGATGADANGFVDIGTHVNLEGYATTSYVDGKVQGITDSIIEVTDDEIKALFS